MSNSFFEDLSKSFFYKIIGLGASFLVQVIITRYLGIENYGLWNKAVSWMQIYIVISLMGNQKKLLKDASSDITYAFNQYFHNIIQVGVLFSLLYLIYIIAGINLEYIKTADFKIVTWIAFIYGLFTVVNRLSTSILQAVQKNYLTIINTLVLLPILNIVSIASFLYILGNNVFILLSFPMSSLVSISIFGYLIVKYIGKKIYNYNFQFKYNEHFWVNDIAKTLLPYINIVILSFFLLEDDIGGYSAAYKFGILLMVFSNVFISFTPVIVKYLENNKFKLLERSFLDISKILLVVVFPAFFTFMCFAEHLMMIFGPRFIEYALIMKIIAIGFYFDSITGPIGQILNMSNHENVEKNINLSAAVINILLVYLLTKNYGVLGAAIAFAIPQVVANLSKLYWVYRKIKIRTVSLNHIWIISIQVLFTLILISIEGNVNIILIYISLLVIYTFIVFVFQLINKSEILNIINMK